jgi:TonB family protein
MPEVWKNWEGQIVNEEFPLLRYVGGSPHSAVFASKRADREPQEVAIKLILADAGDPELQLSWWELATKLSHPHLLRLFQRGRCQLDGKELLYVVTEYAEESLAQIIPYRPLTPAETGDMLSGVVEALAYLHGKGFVHGHIKPANIMAIGDQIKVSSDGLCGVGESSRVLREASVYAAPEIANGESMSPAADVWSLGMTLVEALTQSPPAWEETGTAGPKLPESLPEPFLDVASHSLRPVPRLRWTIAEIANRLRQPSPADRKTAIRPTKSPKSALGPWGYIIPAIAAILLLAILGPKMIHRKSSSDVSQVSAVEPAAGQQEGKAGQPPQGASGNGKSNASRTSVATNTSSAAASGSNTGRAQGAVDQQVLPEVSRNALGTVHGKLKVRIKVTVDSSGKVILAKFESRGPSNYFAERSLQAARRWTFKPPQVGGQGVPSEWVLRFEFEKSGANVRPTQTYP